jgi:hypothetical protein
VIAYFGLPVSDVAADETIHGNGLLHVFLDFEDAAKLILRLLVGESGLEFYLPFGILREGNPLASPT